MKLKGRMLQIHLTHSGVFVKLVSRVGGGKTNIHREPVKTCLGSQNSSLECKKSKMKQCCSGAFLNFMHILIKGLCVFFLHDCNKTKLNQKKHSRLLVSLYSSASPLKKKKRSSILIFKNL